MINDLTLSGIDTSEGISLKASSIPLCSYSIPALFLLVIEKPSWERKRNKELKIGDRIYHPVQRDPGGIWLQIASKQDDVQSQVILVDDLQKLIHNSVDFHSSQHRREAATEAASGVVFISSGAFVSFAYYILNLLY